MPTNQQHYADLIRACVFDASYYAGAIQDRSAAKRAMAFAGNPTWSRIASLPALKQAAVLDGTASVDPAARILDVTGTFSVEWCGVPMEGFLAPTTLLSQVGPVSGGFAFMWDDVNAVYVLALYDNAGALARSITTPAASAVLLAPTHVLMTSSAGGTVGTAKINGRPVACALGGAGVAANINADGPVIAGGAASGIIASLLARAWATVHGNEDATALHGAIRDLTGGEV